MTIHRSTHRDSIQHTLPITTPRTQKPLFARIYMVGAVGVLLLTTVFWSILSAKIHEHNADQLVGSFLFDHGQTFQGAQFPSQHSFLLKWPLFFLVHLLGSSAVALDIVTVFVSLLTVGSLAFIIYRIERRPLVFATICLALASMLLFIPPESYPGALLPVNFAMLANRNIEYIIYVAALILLIKSPRLIHWRLISAVILITILIASDKLFLALSLGGSLIALVIYTLHQHTIYRNLAVRWIVASIASSVLAFSTLWLISITHLTSIINSDTALGPYSFVPSFKDLGLGIIYGILGLFTNLGANPAFDTTVAAQLPAATLRQLTSFSGIGYLMNGLLAIGGLVVVVLIGRSSLHQYKIIASKHKHSLYENHDTPLQLSVLLISTSLAALCVFVATNHYYAVDARYLTICLFTIAISFAAYLRSLTIPPPALLAIGVVLICSIGTGVFTATTIAHRSTDIYHTVDTHNNRVSDSLAQHPVDSLIGDYWRVLPIKLGLPANQVVLPLADCSSPRDVLTSKAWHQDLTRHSFAYLLPLKASITGYPACNVKQVVKAYGRPNSSQVIAGTVNNPEEILLYYDYGIRDLSKSTKPPASSILPVTFNNLPPSQCPSGHTIMSIVAHQDDDLLFMNPDLLHGLRNGACVRTVYLTAGDAGSDTLYWLGREEGSKAAYAQMLGIEKPDWVSRTVDLSPGHYATIAKIKNNPQVSLIFMRLPDGNIDGQGFSATHHESLRHLETGLAPVLHTVDNQSTYTSNELIATLTSLMNAYKPQELHTQALTNLSKRYPDHNDHLLAGWYTQQAYTGYLQQQPDAHISFYIGYPIRERPENKSPQDIKDTEAAFFAYASHDKGTCESEAACSKMSYIYYLKRQYQVTQP